MERWIVVENDKVVDERGDDSTNNIWLKSNVNTIK